MLQQIDRDVRRRALWSMHPPLVCVNMRQFKAKFNVTSDNAWIAEIVQATKGKFLCTNPALVDALCDANVFYTLTGKESVITS